MKYRITFIISALFFLLPGTSRAQGTVSDLESDFRGRLSVEADHKLAKGLHLGLEAEGRFNDNFGSFSRFQAGASISYKALPWLKLGGGYLFIGKINSSGELKPRHRFYLDAKGTWKSGDWNFSLKERLQLTHRNVSNPYSNTPNALQLKSRLKALYKGFGRIQPYALAEARVLFNAPACTATWDGEEYYGYSFNGYTDSYLNRIRGGLGVEYKLNKKSSIELFSLTDYCYDKKAKTSVSLAGVALESLTYKQNLNFTIGAGYKFSF